MNLMPLMVQIKNPSTALGMTIGKAIHNSLKQAFILKRNDHTAAKIPTPIAPMKISAYNDKITIIIMPRNLWCDFK